MVPWVVTSSQGPINVLANMRLSDPEPAPGYRQPELQGDSVGCGTGAVTRSGSDRTVHLDNGTVETHGQPAPGGSLSLLGESRVASNIRGFFATRIGSALPDTGKSKNSFKFHYSNTNNKYLNSRLANKNQKSFKTNAIFINKYFNILKYHSK